MKIENYLYMIVQYHLLLNIIEKSIHVTCEVEFRCEGSPQCFVVRYVLVFCVLPVVQFRMTSHQFNKLSLRFKIYMSHVF